MKQPTEIIWTHVDEDFLYFDGYFLTEKERETFEGEEYGQVLAVLDLVTHRVIYFDNIWRSCQNLTDTIEEAKKQYPPLKTIKVFNLNDWEGEQWGQIMVFDHDGEADVNFTKIAKKEFDLLINGKRTGTDSLIDTIITQMNQLGYVAKIVEKRNIYLVLG